MASPLRLLSSVVCQLEAREMPTVMAVPLDETMPTVVATQVDSDVQHKPLRDLFEFQEVTDKAPSVNLESVETRQLLHGLQHGRANMRQVCKVSASPILRIDDDSLRLLLAFAAKHSPAPRAVCKKWGCLFDEKLRGKCSASLLDLLESYRMSLESYHVSESALLPMRWILRYAYPSPPVQPRYECAACRAEVKELRACIEHGSSARERRLI